MKKYLLYVILFFCTIQQFHSQESQEDGVVALNLPVRNSLKFNQYVINPTFSFVRQQNKYISFTNKREWVQFDDAPQTYLFSYSGRFSENTGMGVGLFQQNYGVLSTFGGILNYAYNAVLNNDSNLTFGMNLGVYKSGINEGRVITNFPDSSLDNIPSNTMLTINPGINYGTDFFDFGVSVNNLVSYNFKSSKIIEDNPEQSIQGHVMYTGYMNTRGFFDESKFSTLIRSEFKKDETVISGVAMLTVPKGIWAQAGYNMLYGVSAGIGLNITSQIAIEYNYEKAVGDLSSFGNSHDITLAFKFNNRYRYDYSGDDEEAAFIIPEKRSKRTVAKRKATTTSTTVDRKAVAEAKAKARAEAVANAKAKAQERAQLAAQAKAEREARIEAAAQTRKEAQAKTNEVAKTALEAENKVKQEQESLDKLATSKTDEATRIKLEAEQKARLEREAEEKLLVAKAAEVQAKLAEAARIKAEEQAKAKLAEAENKARLEAETKAKLAESARIRAQEQAKAQLAAAVKAKADEEAKIKLEAEQKAILEREAKEKLAAVKAAEEAQAKLAEAARIKAEEDAKSKLAEAENQARLAAEAKARVEEEARIRLAEAAQDKADAEAQAKLEAENEAKTIVPEPTDAATRAMSDLAKSTQDSKIAQQELLVSLSESVASKNQDLKDLKEENDLSEQGIFKAPKAFKSVSAENAALESLKSQIDASIKSQDLKISELEKLYNERLKEVPNKNDSVNASYLKAIQTLKSEQLQIVQSKEALISTLEEIKIATEVERKRRIKRAAYDNEQDRYLKDRAALEQIKRFTPAGTVALTAEDFDFGAEQSGNIQIVKDVNNVESGYYLVLAVHSDVEKRDAFLEKAVSLGQTNINFFYDVNTSKYYIYYEKFDNVETAKQALQSKGTAPYDSKRSMVKVEN